jgi:hypothetical protein
LLRTVSFSAVDAIWQGSITKELICHLKSMWYTQVKHLVTVETDEAFAARKAAEAAARALREPVRVLHENVAIGGASCGDRWASGN